MAAKYDLGTAEGTVKIKYDGAGVKQAGTGLDGIQSKSDSTGKKFEGLANKAGVAGLAIAAGIGLAANSAIGFEKQISAIGAVSGASGKELDAFRKKALQLGADTQFSASEAASAMEELSKAGISTADILNGAADATVALAAAGGVDLPTAATIAANAMNSFGVTAKQLPAIVDTIAGAANASAIDVGDLAQSLQQVGAVAHLSGLDFRDTAVAIAEMGNAGVTGSDAGTSLKTFLQNLIPTTKQQIDLFKTLGLTTKDGANAFFDAKGKLKSFADVQQVLQTSLKGMSQEQKLATLQTLFGSDAIRAAAVFADQGAAGFDSLAGSIGKTKAADVAAARMDNAAGRIEQLKGSVETLGIAFGELLLPAIDKVSKILTSLANWLTNLSSGWKTTIVVVLGVVGGILLMVAVVQKIIAIIRVFQTAWVILNAVFAASPIGLIIVGILLLVAVFVILWLKCAAFRNFFIRIWGYIWGFMKAVGAWFAGPFANFFVALWHKMQAVWNAVWKVIKLVIDLVIAYVKAWWKIISTIFNFFAPLIKGVFDFVIALIKLWWSVFSALWTVVFTVLKAIITPFITWTIAIWKFLFDTVISAVKFWWGVFSGFWKRLYNWLAPLVLSLVNLVVGYWKWLYDHVSAILTTWWGVFSGFWSGVWDLIKYIWGLIVAQVKGAVDRIGAIFEFFAGLLGKVKKWFDGLKDAASGGVGSLVSYIADVPKKILNALGDFGGMLYGAGKSIIEGLGRGIRDAVHSVTEAVSWVLHQARQLLPFSPAKEGPFSGKGWTTYSGAAIMDGLATGIEARARSAVLAMQNALRAVNQAGVAAPVALAGAARSGVASAPLPPVYVSLNVDGKELGRAAVLDPRATSASAQRGDQLRSWASTPGKVGASA